LNNFISEKSKNIKGEFSFYLFILSLFLLPSAFSISTIFLLVCLVTNTVKYRKKFLLDKWITFFFSASILMIISCLINTLYNDHLNKYNLNSSLTWIGLANWLPLFWCYLGFKPFLNTPSKRKVSSLALFCGTFPVLISGIGQYFFSWYGPFEFLNGLIIWYQRPIENFSGLTGLFNNANYMGSWLNIIWPTALACIINSDKNLIRNFANYIFTAGLSISTVFTFSRAAWLGILVGTLLMYGQKIYKFIITFLLFLSLIISAIIYPIFGLGIQSFLRSTISQSLWMKFSNFQYSRIGIWETGIQTIFRNPFFGSGAASFPAIFKDETGLWKGHSHNLPLELIISYGIPVGILVITPIIIIVYLSVKKSFLTTDKISIFDKSWITSLIVLLISQMVDIQYFDGRFSIVLWLLISGSSNIINENNNQNLAEFKNKKVKT
tara:strand:+ start:1041 stop:2351 length:1311 start_codon:yes stop_codon:yes gene_type:complete